MQRIPSDNAETQAPPLSYLMDQEMLTMFRNSSSPRASSSDDTQKPSFSQLMASQLVTTPQTEETNRPKKELTTLEQMELNKKEQKQRQKKIERKAAKKEQTKARLDMGGFLPKLKMKRVSRKEIDDDTSLPKLLKPNLRQKKYK